MSVGAPVTRSNRQNPVSPNAGNIRYLKKEGRMKNFFLMLPLLPEARATAYKRKKITGGSRDTMTVPDSAIVYLREMNTQVKIGGIAMLLLARR
jgi:hypothetical protein